MLRSYARALLLPRRGEGPLPGHRLELPATAADPARLARYHEVCGFRRTDRLPVTYPHLVAFPLAMDLMTRRDFPFRLPGLVHVANRVEQTRPIAPAERLTYHVWAAGPVPHPRGTAFDIAAEAADGGGTPVWRSASTYLRRRAAGPGAAPAGDAAPGPVEGPGTPWRVPAGTGRRYAAVSGDRNPIHLHPLAARLFGFPGAIAHGMWTKARCLAALEDALPDAFTAEVAFRAPVRLPAEVTFHAGPAGPDRSFELRAAQGGRRHLHGRVTAD
ncbi:MaoC family dehydratase [Streptomyces litchfieldiae]|uniref:MaoC/PaaZ C-terminal domain-containing protein n=1 Tax=Streptomyces litchfieldiae TaxID=3075543 RepID=A0ABU2MW93_9ACTN|nr:MaoC/PaaZ C-terminal domain-containing protein [Streptomyces sp. DSM 44938]MDT0345918.1 MaoC/PaaZ C-terminal domain-containing protein [Streptomyces sp. DSM 44938]